MTIAQSFDLQSEAEMPDLSFAAMRMAMLHEAEEHELPLLTNSDQEIICGTPFGNLGAAATDTGLCLRVSAARPDWLFMLKESMVEHLLHVIPDAIAGLRWSDAEEVGALPPNFQFVKVQSVQPVCSSFIRVQVKVANLTSYDETALHFRVVLPQPGQTNVVWPSVGANGATIWPKGDAALHKPVYTARRVDHENGLLEFDVFLHDGGRVTDWVRQLSPGDTTAIVGPGGGGVPAVDQINLYGDETGFPAIARIVETLPPHVTGRVALSPQDDAARDYPFTPPKGMTVDWLPAGQSLTESALADLAAMPDHFLWFAAEKTQVQPVQKALKAAGIPTTSSYAGTYWSKSS